MRTPAGKECRHYYEDFHRGRDVQECRLIQANPLSLRWRPSDCKRCPVPDVLNANSSPDLELHLSVIPRLLGLGRQLEVSASCLKHHIQIEDAFVGCPKCIAERPGLELFWQALEQDNEEGE
jgi:hypothetical protein